MTSHTAPGAADHDLAADRDKGVGAGRPRFGSDADARRCAWDGCTGHGAYRAPKDRSLRDYVFFCLDHVRAYNAQWNFHAGLSTTEMEREIRSAATWDRPTWKLGSLGAKFRRGSVKDPVHVDDPFGFAEGTTFDPRREERAPRPPEDSVAARARAKALKILELTAPLTLEALRRRYKALVKQHHPDVHGGSPEAESRMKVINEAYQVLRAELAPQQA